MFKILIQPSLLPSSSYAIAKVSLSIWIMSGFFALRDSKVVLLLDWVISPSEPMVTVLRIPSFAVSLYAIAYVSLSTWMMSGCSPLVPSNS